MAAGEASREAAPRHGCEPPEGALGSRDSLNNEAADQTTTARCVGPSDITALRLKLHSGSPDLVTEAVAHSP